MKTSGSSEYHPFNIRDLWRDPVGSNLVAVILCLPGTVAIQNAATSATSKSNLLVWLLFVLLFVVMAIFMCSVALVYMGLAAQGSRIGRAVFVPWTGVCFLFMFLCAKVDGLQLGLAVSSLMVVVATGLLWFFSWVDHGGEEVIIANGLIVALAPVLVTCSLLS